MGLIFSGLQDTNLGGVSLEAFDTATGRRVVVKVSQEAREVFGLDRAMAVGNRKFDLGQLEDDGTVRVTPADIQD